MAFKIPTSIQIALAGAAILLIVGILYVSYLTETALK